MSALQKHTAFIKKTATTLGFEHCGIAKAQRLDEDAARLEKWLAKGMHGNMHYMEKHFDMRVDPSRLVPGAKSVISLLKNYFPSQKQNNDTTKSVTFGFVKNKKPKAIQIKANFKGNLAATGFFRCDAEFIEKRFGCFGFENHTNFIPQKYQLEKLYSIKTLCLKRLPQKIKGVNFDLQAARSADFLKILLPSIIFE